MFASNFIFMTRVKPSLDTIGTWVTARQPQAQQMPLVAQMAVVI
jgi:hypothetical protein